MLSIRLGILSFLLGINSLIYSQSSELDAVFQEIKTDHEVVGMSVAIIKGNEISFSQGYGLRDIDRSFQLMIALFTALHQFQNLLLLLLL